VGDHTTNGKSQNKLLARLSNFGTHGVFSWKYAIGGRFLGAKTAACRLFEKCTVASFSMSAKHMRFLGSSGESTRF
jgi:hypothetical protein